MIIQSGGIRPNTAIVNDAGQLETYSTTISSIREATVQGKAFGVSTPVFTVNTTGGEMFWIQNTSKDKKLFIQGVYMYWNGGNTTFIKDVEARIGFGYSAPTNNYAQSGAGILNRSLSNAAEASVYVWNGVGNGMTLADGMHALYGVFNPQMVSWPIDGAIVLGTNDTMSIYAKALVEAGRFAFNALLYWK